MRKVLIGLFVGAIEMEARSLYIKKRLPAIAAAGAVFAAAACATSGGAGAAGNLSLEKAIEQAAREIAGRLPEGTRAAVAAFEAGTGALSNYIMDELSYALGNNGIEAAERYDIDYALEELNLRDAGNLSDESKRSIGRFIGAQYVISGDLVKTGWRYRFRANLVNVETAKGRQAAALFVRNDDAMKAIIAALTSDETAARDALPSQKAVPEGMAHIRGGTFMMGSPLSEPERGVDETQHRVTVSPFYMGKYEVTVGEFRAFVNATGYKTTAETSGGGGYVWIGLTWEDRADADWKNPYFTQGDSHPVTMVSWYDAVEYCNWRSKAEGLSPAYTVSGTEVTWNRKANGYRLPTEAEWEYACRAGTVSPFNTGDNITTDESNYNGNYPYNGNAKGTYREKTTDAGSFHPNAWGLYDMHGNVWEWCWDWYGDYPAGAQIDPTGAASGSDRVDRGGSWGNDARDLRGAVRYYGVPSYRNGALGFRLARG